MTGCRYKWPHSTFQFQPARDNSPMVGKPECMVRRFSASEM
jgi:hypothetical protein